jgi:hypothetical protein
VSEGPKAPISEPSVGDSHASDGPTDVAAAHDPFDDLLKRAARLTPLPARETVRGRVPQRGSSQLEPGSKLWDGRFEITRRLGAGGMGVVYEARDRERSERVALKTLARMSPTNIYRLKHEFRALAEVAHESLVVLHELFADDQHCMFTMELVEGEPFDRYVRTQPDALDEPRLRGALAQLARGVAAIHAAGKLHRDLKPSNVLVTAEGRVVILDFGLVAAQHGSDGRDDDRGSGTPAYMAPEQCSHEPATAASDWYAVGVMLFEALTGRLPFEDATKVLMRRKQSEPAPAARARTTTEAALPADLEALCDALLAREPSARPSGEAVIEALRVEAARPSLDPQRGGVLVGRRRELAVLRAALARSRERAVMVCLAGESGIGKSALCHAFAEEARATARAVVLDGRCYEREYVPYKGLDRAIDALMRYLLALEPSELSKVLSPDVGALARVFPVLDRVDAIASTPTRESFPAEDAHALRRRAFGALTDILTQLAAIRPLIVWIDDAQWIDGDSIALLDHLLGASKLKLMLVVCQRAVGEGPLVAQLGQRVSVETLEVGPLATQDAIELALRRLEGLATGPDRQAMAASIADEARGNPFFAVELARNALSSAPPAALSLDQAVRERARELGADARELIELLALAARPMPPAVLGLALHDGDKTADLAPAQRALERLRKAQLARESQRGALECSHDRVRIALAETLPESRARELHARLARAWAAHGEADPEVLFTHCYAAGQRAQAAMHALHAAQTSGTSLAFDRSASFLAHAIELLSEHEIAEHDLRARYAEALSLSGRWADAAHAYESAARASGSEDTRIELLRRSAVHLLGSGQSEQGLPRLREVFAARGVRWPQTRGLALLGGLFAVLAVLPQLLRGRKIALSHTTSATGSPALEPLLEGAGLVTPYDMVRGLYFLLVFTSRALRGDDGRAQAVALAMLSSVLASFRRTRGLARVLAERASTHARELDRDTPHAAVTLTFSAYTRIACGELQTALALGVEAEKLLGPLPRAHSYQFWNARTVQSMALVLLGRMAEARRSYEGTAQLARELGDDLAMLGGDSPLRYLVQDDVAGAKALMARKQALLERVPTTGALHRLITVERLMCALYDRSGADVLWPEHGARGPRLIFFDASMLHACCALQGVAIGHPRAGEAARYVKRAIRQLDRLAPTDGVRGMSAQLRAAHALMRGETALAREELERATTAYTRAQMGLHAALIRYRTAQLDGSVSALDQSEDELRALGVANPQAWATMLAPGLGRVPATRAVR